MKSTDHHQRIAHKIVKRASTLWSHIKFEVDASPSLVTISVIADVEGQELINYDPMIYLQWDYGQIGKLTAVAEPLNLLKDDCVRHFDEMQQQLGRELKLFRVGHTILLPGARGMGVGSELYVKTTQAIARYNAVLVPDRCIVGGQTTPEAERIWKSRSIRDRLKVVGDSVFWGGR